MTREEKNIYRREYYLKNKEKVISYVKKYYQDNKEKCKKVSSDYRKIHRNLININRNKNRSNNPLVKKGENCRKRTRMYLIRRGYVPGSRMCQAKDCNNVGVIHHWDYDNHFDISFVCKEHHQDIHNGNIPDGIIRHF